MNILALHMTKVTLCDNNRCDHNWGEDNWCEYTLCEHNWHSLFVPQVSYAKEIDAQFIDFDGLVRNCDFICVCCNLTPQVRYMLVLYEWFNVL